MLGADVGFGNMGCYPNRVDPEGTHLLQVGHRTDSGQQQNACFSLLHTVGRRCDEL